MEENALEMSITMVFTCLLLSCQISIPFRENSNVVLFQSPFHILLSLATCGSSAFMDSVPS